MSSIADLKSNVFQPNYIVYGAVIQSYPSNIEPFFYDGSVPDTMFGIPFKLDPTNEKFVLPLTLSTDVPYGILVNDIHYGYDSIQNNQPTPVNLANLGSVVFVKAGATIAYNDVVAWDATNGLFVPAGGGVNKNIGIALSSAAVGEGFNLKVLRPFVADVTA